MLRPKVILPVGVLIVGLSVAGLFMATRPEAEIVPRVPAVISVRSQTIVLESRQLHVETHGTVAPRTESELIPEVSGPVTWVSSDLVSGGFFDAGDALFRIDTADYDADLERDRASLARRQSELGLARKELERNRGLSKRKSLW